MKKILFVIDEIIVGGAQKSLLSLLSTIDYSRCEVDLLIFDESGGFRSLIPPQVRVIRTASCYKEFFSPIRKSVIGLVKKGKVFNAIVRLFLLFLTKLTKDETYYYKCSFLVKPKDLREYYDTAIACHYRMSNYYIVKKVNAGMKCGWYHHGEYNVSDKVHQFDRWCYSRLNRVACVSESIHTELQNHFPGYFNKFVVIKNIISTQLIRGLSEQPCELDMDGRCFKIMTVGRLSPEKGLNLVVESCQKLLERGYTNIKWFLIGDGVERKRIESLIKRHHLENTLILLGEKLNPYKYIRCTDVYVHPSLVESFGLAIAEAKILYKPVVSTDTPGALEQIQNNINGLITGKDSSEISETIIMLFDNDCIRKAIIENLKQSRLDNYEEIEKFYEMIYI